MKFERINHPPRWIQFERPVINNLVLVSTIFGIHDIIFPPLTFIVHSTPIYRIFTPVLHPVIVELRKRHIEKTVNKVYTRKGLTNERKL